MYSNELEKFENLAKNILNRLCIFTMVSNMPDFDSLLHVKNAKDIFLSLKSGKNFKDFKERHEQILEKGREKSESILIQYGIALKDAVNIMESNDEKKKNIFLKFIDIKLNILNTREKDLSIKVNEQNELNVKVSRINLGNYKN